MTKIFLNGSFLVEKLETTLKPTTFSTFFDVWPPFPCTIDFYTSYILAFVHSNIKLLQWHIKESMFSKEITTSLRYFTLMRSFFELYSISKELYFLEFYSIKPGHILYPLLIFKKFSSVNSWNFFYYTFIFHFFFRSLTFPDKIPRGFELFPLESLLLELLELNDTSISITRFNSKSAINLSMVSSISKFTYFDYFAYLIFLALLYKFFYWSLIYLSCLSYFFSFLHKE